MKRLLLFAVFLCGHQLSYGQAFTRSDTLRGSVTPERAWWDLVYYHLEVEVMPEEKRITGQNTMHYRVLSEQNILQIDLQDPLKITEITQDGQVLRYRKEGSAYFVQLTSKQPKNAVKTLIIQYEGQPRIAVRAPWDGGFSWERDDNGKHFIATSNQSLGASVWWPCRDHMGDEVDSMLISVEVPEDLVDVSNGRLRAVEHNEVDKTKTYHWFVGNPINNYGVNLNIGDYVSWEEVYAGEKGPLDVTYWALRADEKRARKQFKEVPRMLEAFEHWMGPYPFYEDGFQLVQAPYLGMEHQSSITYGNGFQNGYRGRDLSETGWGMKFDFIIVHESGHEWFANNLTHADVADMWLHESFTAYSESLFLEYWFSKEAGREYVRGTRFNIENAKPMIGAYGVDDHSYPIDVYYKGSNMLNTLRSIVNDDEAWRGLMRGLGERFYHSTTSSKEVEAFMAETLGLSLESFFDQYLRDRSLPVLEYYFKEGKLYYRWTQVVSNFAMPVDVSIGERKVRLEPRRDWQSVGTKAQQLEVDLNYYISTLKSR
ncbi:MAG: M1 family metallopeptidase [Bacteroidota bacterium]